ncbi:hypothetical protein HBB16_21790 [Pseudonocardia sp. MCCB 268]|nr:hypothetical protein [Pseudonocardia cytotoxica]
MLVGVVIDQRSCHRRPGPAAVAAGAGRGLRPAVLLLPVRGQHALHADLRGRRSAGPDRRRLLEHRGGAEAGRLPGSISSIAIIADAKRVAVMNPLIPVAAAALCRASPSLPSRCCGSPSRSAC